jgi:hypothetical protein
MQGMSATKRAAAQRRRGKSAAFTGLPEDFAWLKARRKI